MAVPYKLYQDVREESTTQGKWYARATYYGKLTTDQLADKIEAATTLTKTDIVACITAFLQYVNEGLQSGQRVVLEKFGAFRVGMKTTPADTAKEWTPSKNLKSLHIIFQPAVQVDADKKRRKSLLTGVKVEEMQGYNKPKEEDGDDTPTP